MFVIGRAFQSNLMLASKAGAYPSEAAFMCSHLGRLLALPAHNRLDWQGLAEINTRAYY
jgi:hypothetical protein